MLTVDRGLKKPLLENERRMRRSLFREDWEKKRLRAREGSAKDTISKTDISRNGKARVLCLE